MFVEQMVTHSNTLLLRVSIPDIKQAGKANKETELLTSLIRQSPAAVLVFVYMAVHLPAVALLPFLVLGHRKTIYLHMTLS